MSVSKNQITAGIVGIILVLLIVLSGGIFEDVDKDVYAIHKFPGSGELNVFNQGLNFQGFGSVDIYQKRFQYWFTADANSGEARDQSKKVIFNDAGIGWLDGTISLKMPLDDKNRKQIAIDFGNMETLIQELVSPTIDKVIFNTGTLMSSYESYAAKKTDLIRYIEDQLKYGTYATKQVEEAQVDELSGKTKYVTVAKLIPDKENGGYLRQEEAPLSKYGIEVVAVSVKDIRYEDRIVDQIRKQQEARMQIQTAIAKAKEAEQEAIRVEAAGKAEAAKARWDQEVIKAKAVTEAQQEYEVAELKAKQALEYKKETIAKGQAEAEANRLKVLAGLTPQEKAEWEYKTAIGVAKEIFGGKGIKFPETLITGNDKNGKPVDPFTAVGLESLRNMINSRKK